MCSQEKEGSREGERGAEGRGGAGGGGAQVPSGAAGTRRAGGDRRVERGGAGGSVEEGVTPATSAARGFARERRGRWAWLLSFPGGRAGHRHRLLEERGGEVWRTAASLTAAPAMEETQPLPQSELRLCDSLIIWVSRMGRGGPRGVSLGVRFPPVEPEEYPGPPAPRARRAALPASWRP